MLIIIVYYTALTGLSKMAVLPWQHLVPYIRKEKKVSARSILIKESSAIH